MIIDAHNHADWHGHNFEAFIKNMDDNHIDKTWLLSWETPIDEYDPNSIWAFPGAAVDNAKHFPIPFALGLEYKKRAPDRFILGYAPDPRRPEAVQALKSAVAIYGVQTCGEVKLRMMYDNPDAIAMFRYCGEAGLPVTLHFDYDTATQTGHEFPRRSWWYGGGIDTFERVLKLCPETYFLGHAPGFWCHISNDDKGYTESYPTGEIIRGGMIERLLEKYPNLYCDLSAGSCHNALSRDLDYTREFLTQYADRVCFARDYFDSIHMQLINSLNLGNDVLEKIYHKNAEKLLCRNNTNLSQKTSI